MTISTCLNASSEELNVCVFDRPVRPRSKAGDDGHSAGPTKMSVIEGEDAVLPCDVHSVPPPIISWAKERQLISPYSPR